MVNFGVREALAPLADELRGFGAEQLELLRGITAEQRRTNELLEQLAIKPAAQPAAKKGTAR